MAGNVDTRTEVIPASGVLTLGNANFFFAVSSSAAFSLQLKRTGLTRGASQENYSGQLAGLQLGRVQRWDFATITGTAGQTVTFMYGFADVKEDVTQFNQQIAVISGVTAVADSPSSTIATTQQAVANAAAVTVVANLARRRISFCNPSTNAGSVFLQKTGDGAGKGIELQPGTTLEFRTTAAIDIRNDSGAALNINTFEET